MTLNFCINENEVRRGYTSNRDYRANLASFMIDRFKREMGEINISQRTAATSPSPCKRLYGATA